MPDRKTTKQITYFFTTLCAIVARNSVPFYKTWLNLTAFFVILSIFQGSLTFLLIICAHFH